MYNPDNPESHYSHRRLQCMYRYTLRTNNDSGQRYRAIGCSTKFQIYASNKWFPNVCDQDLSWDVYYVLHNDSPVAERKLRILSSHRRLNCQINSHIDTTYINIFWMTLIQMWFWKRWVSGQYGVIIVGCRMWQTYVSRLLSVIIFR